MVLKALKRRRLTGYFFISPWIIGFVIFLLGPILYALYISFTNWDMLSLPRFIGLQNYLDLFSDNLFKHSLFVTMRFVLTIVSISMVLSLSLAMLLNSNSKVMYFRTMFYIPSVISGIAMAILWSWVFSPDFGILNYALSLFKIQGPNWLGDPLYAPWAFVIMMLPVFVGAPMIIFIAGLQNIPKYFYEAADIDGANPIQKFIKITLPMLSPVILFNLITMIIGAFRIFVQAYILAGKYGNPGRSLYFFVMYLYNTAFQDMNMGSAMAMLWMFFVIVFILTVIVLRSSSVWVYYEEEGR